MEYGEHKDQKKIPEKGPIGTYFEYKNYFHTAFFFVFKVQSFLFSKIFRIKFSSWLPKSFPPMPCFCSQKSNSVQNVPVVMQLLCRVISSGQFRNPNFGFIGNAEFFRRV